jgi:hypothetical protein
MAQVSLDLSIAERLEPIRLSRSLGMHLCLATTMVGGIAWNFRIPGMHMTSWMRKLVIGEALAGIENTFELIQGMPAEELFFNLKA